MNTSNLKKINEYKRILRKLLDDEGLRGVSLKGASYYTGDVVITARAFLSIQMSFDGPKVSLMNEETGSTTIFNFADPTSIDLLKKLFSDEVQRILNGPKNA